MSILLSATALALAAYQYWRQDRLQHRMAAIEQARRDEELASRQAADVTAFTDSDRSVINAPAYRLILRNRGPSVAVALSVHIPGAPDGLPERPKLLDDPPGSLDVGQDYPLRLDVRYEMDTSFEARIAWIDISGPREKRMAFNL